MIGRTNAVVGGSSIVAYAQLNYPVAGITITATSTGLPTKTGVTDATGKASFRNIKNGIYTFATNGGASSTVTVDSGVVNVPLTISRVTVSTDTSGATVVTATNQAETVTKTATISGGQAIFYDLPADTWVFSDGTLSRSATIASASDTSVILGATDIYAVGDSDGVTFYKSDASGTKGEQVLRVTWVHNWSPTYLDTYKFTKGDYYRVEFDNEYGTGTHRTLKGVNTYLDNDSLLSTRLNDGSSSRVQLVRAGYDLAHDGVETNWDAITLYSEDY